MTDCKNIVSCIVALMLLSGSVCYGEDVSEKSSDANYSQLILKDKPIGYWQFDRESDSSVVANAVSDLLPGQLVGDQLVSTNGPLSPMFPKFSRNENTALQFAAGKGWIEFSDPGETSDLDFDNGDSITLEAWVNPSAKDRHDGLVYVVGKGRTERTGEKSINQNYSMRLKTFRSQGRAALSFLFRSRGDQGDWHRWTSKNMMSIGDGWHHLVLTYEFGKPESIRGYIDGKATKGKWDLGGATDKAPYVSDDLLLIGTAMNQAANSSFRGSIDEVAIYRKALTEEQVKSHFDLDIPELTVDWSGVTNQDVLVQVYENIHNEKSWRFRRADLTDTFRSPWLAFPAVPHKYNEKGLIANRSNPYLMRALTQILLPKGKQRLLVRARNGARLFLDGEKVGETKFHSISSSAHGRVTEIDRSFAEHVRPLHRGDAQKVIEVEGDGKLHNLRFEMIVGGRNHRHDFGETCVSIAPADGKDNFVIIAGTGVESFPLTDSGWRNLRKASQQHLIVTNASRRKLAAKDEEAYWAARHSNAQTLMRLQAPLEVPPEVEGMRANNFIDQYVNAVLAKQGLEQSTPLDDLMFLRKLSLDTIGTTPTLAQIETYLADEPSERREKAIDRFLSNPGRADNWVGYWQDVLAENPNIIKPTLNNTGPFRTWIYESFYDNKPFDRFVTELIQMEGSSDYGGPAGFAKATQNDAPMAAKAYVLSQAFLGVNLKCARCHDAPAHDYLQRDLFNIAAMLKRSSQKVPESSSIPGFDFENNSLLVEVTLKPGEVVEANWPFDSIIEGSYTEAPDTRNALAELMVHPSNQRFAQVIINRLWKRYLGMGFTEPVDDWNGQPILLPELLNHLAVVFVEQGYDLRAMERMIFSSDLYQRQAVVNWHAATVAGSKFRFESPILRSMRAEQIVDSMFTACGKDMNAGHVTLDPDGAMSPATGFDLGFPRRAWEFTSLSNERDRPSLSLPFAQPFVSFMKTFGWRDTRQEPLTERERESTASRPAVVQNGVLSRRFTRCSDDSWFTEQALQVQPIEELVKNITLQVLGRHPSADEMNTIVNILTPGYESRIVPNAAIVEPARLPINRVSWSNHLSQEANEIKIELQKAVEKGDPPTERLEKDWRERFEDVLWAQLNSPEYLFVP